MRTRIRLLVLALLLCLSSSSAFAIALGWGGQEDFAYFVSSQTNDNYMINYLRLWFSSTFSKNFNFYVRAKLEWVNLVNPSPSATDEEKNQVTLDIDQGFFNIKTASSGFSLNMMLGRAYYRVGTGAVFYGIADGAGVKTLFDKAELNLFYSYTGLLLASTNPYNFSSEDTTTGAKRSFAAFEGKYHFTSWMSLSLAALLQMDGSDDKTTRYQSRYFLAGLKGTLFTRLNYLLEFIYQTGKSPDEVTATAGNDPSNDISAMALVFKGQWMFFDKSKSGLFINAAWASGCPKRDSYTPGGLPVSATDTQFYTFGTYSTGFVFEPELSNLLYAALGFMIMPFPNASTKLTFSYYMKADKDAPTSEEAVSSSNNNSGSADLGFAIDLTLSWRIVSDFSLSLGGGLFFPGAGFVNHDMQSLIQIATTLAF